MGNPKVVFRDLKETPFTFKVNNLDLYFSKQISLNRFKRGYLDFRKYMRDKFQSLYLIDVILDEYADISYYSASEPNGFRIVKDGVEITCLNDIILDGQIKMKENLKDE